MLQSQSVVIDNIYLNINRYDYESDEMFYFRIYYITNEIKKNNILKKESNLDNLIGLSMIEMNKHFKKTNYLPEFNLSLA